MNIPPIIVQGDSVTWRDVPTTDNLGNTITSADWTLTYHFGGPTAISAVATASDDGWQVSLTSSITAAMLATETGDANYYWQAAATKGSEKITVGTGTLTIQQSLANAVAGYDGRTRAEQDLTAVEAEIRARISGGATVEYSIGTRRLRKEPLSALMELQSRLKLIVAKERQAQSIANGLGDPRNVYVRFN